MDILTLDWETFYDNDYTLSKMTTEAYIRDPRFEEILLSVKWNSEPSFWILPDRADHFLKNEVDWSQTAVVAHHAHFDGLILSHHHGVKPEMWICTLSAARVIDGPKAGNSLHDLCIRHGIGTKGDYVTFAKGKHLADFSVGELHEYGQYGCNDTDRTYDLAQIFLAQLPLNELKLISLTVKMFTEPVFHGDVAKLRDAVTTERQNKIAMLQQIGLICPACKGAGQQPDMITAAMPCKKCDGMGVNKKPLNSNDQFADLLRKAGAEPETKTSPTTGEQIYAFAKTDPYMQSLVDDEDDEVRVLAETRLAVKSNIIETRAAKFAACAERGAMPVYLSHAGAHTLRPSGGDGMNWLNMSKHNAKRPEMMVLRQSILPPPGHKILAPDSGQGEARIVAWLANQMDLVEAFAQGRDIYSEAATDIYRRPVDRKFELPDGTHPDYIMGQVGKIEILSFGFGSGWYTASLGFLKGVLGAPPIQFVESDLTGMQIDPSRFLNDPKKIALLQAMPSRLEFRDRAIHCAVVWGMVQRYRQRYANIPKFWTLMESVINAMMRGEEMTFGAHGVMRTGKECIYLPNGTKLTYRGIERDQNTGDATYWDGRKRTKIYGSLGCENVVQALHRAIVAEQMLEIADAGIKVALWPYDEIVAVVPDDAAELALEFMIQTMKKSPAWAVGLPLTAEGKIGNTYAEC